MKTTFLTSIFLYTIAVCGLAQVADKSTDISPLMISEKVPNIEITSITGEKSTLLDLAKEKPAIVLFYRGGWCPYCNAHLSEVGAIEKEILDLGYQVIGISPDSPKNADATLAKNELNYSIYSDSEGLLMQAMGIAFKASERSKKRLFDYSDSKNPGILPVPSVFVVDTDGTIQFTYVSPNYKNRISASLLLNVLKELNAEK